MKYYVFVCKKGIKQKYEAHQLNEAIEEVKTGKMTISAASKKFGVPRSTLSDPIHDKVKGPQGRTRRKTTNKQMNFGVLTNIKFPVTVNLHLPLLQWI